MNITNMKNIIVLKNLPSNLVEEAIVVLKPNKTIKKHEYIDKTNHLEKKEEVGKNKEIIEPENSKDYILKEAELIISNFISTIEKPVERTSPKTQLVAIKYKRLKIVTVMLGVLTLLNLIINLVN